MKQHFTLTLSLEVETDKRIKDLDELNVSFNDLKFDNPNIKVIDVPDCFEVMV